MTLVYFLPQIFNVDELSLDSLKHECADGLSIGRAASCVEECTCKRCHPKSLNVCRREPLRSLDDDESGRLDLIWPSV